MIAALLMGFLKKTAGANATAKADNSGDLNLDMEGF